MKKLFSNVLALGIGCVLAFGILELFLRWANPIPSRIKGEKIVLPHNRLYQFENPAYPGLDSLIIHRKNALGFRGPDMPENWEQHQTILAVGGSTTECYFVSEGKDWPAQLQKQLESTYPDVWVNNAGLDGHSSFGHSLLLQDYILPLKPDIVLFLVGANEVGRGDLDVYDKAQLKNKLSPWKRILYHSEVVNLLLNLKRAAKAYDLSLNHQVLKLMEAEHIPTDTLRIRAQIDSDSMFLQAYKNRLEGLIDSCEAHQIQPVFLTQPSLLGGGKDPDTGVNLSTIQWANHNGEAYWARLEAYNDVLRKLSLQRSVLCIDLAKLLPKRSAYYYDAIHFNNAGCEAVGKIIAEKLAPHLASEEESL